MASLNNFGAVFTFGIELETQVHDYFSGLGKSDVAKEANKRREKLERARREYIVEITLEPIDGLDDSDYHFNLEDQSPVGQSMIFQTLNRFYQDAAPKINVRQAQRILEKCGKQVAEYI